MTIRVAAVPFFGIVVIAVATCFALGMFMSHAGEEPRDCQRCCEIVGILVAGYEQAMTHSLRSDYNSSHEAARKALHVAGFECKVAQAPPHGNVPEFRCRRR